MKSKKEIAQAIEDLTGSQYELYVRQAKDYADKDTVASLQRSINAIQEKLNILNWVMGVNQ